MILVQAGECPQTFAAGAKDMPNMLAGLGARGKKSCACAGLVWVLGQAVWAETIANNDHDACPALGTAHDRCCGCS